MGCGQQRFPCKFIQTGSEWTGHMAYLCPFFGDRIRFTNLQRTDRIFALILP
jgi:hypothetical protein